MQPHPLLDKIIKVRDLKNDRQLSELLGKNQSVISKIRAGKSELAAPMMITIHELMGWSIAEIKALVSQTSE